MTEKHSPLPWAADPDDRPGYEWNVHIVEAARPHMRICFTSNTGDSGLSEANAALIVRAVNGLPETIAALEAAGLAIGYSLDMDGTDPGGVLLQAINKINAVLTKLKG